MTNSGGIRREGTRKAAPLVSEEARAFHDGLVVIDGHCDTVLDILGVNWDEEPREPRDFLARSLTGHMDLPRLVEAGVTCQAMALFTDTKRLAGATDWTWRLLETVEDAFARSETFAPARNAADILAAKAAGRVAGLLAIEGGEAIGGPAVGLDNLEAFYASGVRLMTLTWSRRNELGRGVGIEGSDGLSEFGRAVVGRMERLGMIVDASHLSDEALLDLLEIAQRPIVASHSNSRELCPHPRNLTDELAERIAETGGLVALTFAGAFIDPDPAKVSFDRLMDHFERLITVVGAEHVGIGSDFDGFLDRGGVAMPDCTWMPAITAALLARGHSRDDTAAVMGGNWLRVIGEVVGAR